MALWLLKTQYPPVFNYEQLQDGFGNPICFDEPPQSWHPELVTCPRTFNQTTVFGLSSHFFYDVQRDLFHWWTWIYKTGWPGWDVVRYDVRAEDLVCINSSTRTGCLNHVGWYAYSGSITTGSFGQLYSAQSDGSGIAIVSPLTTVPVSSWRLPVVTQGGGDYLFAVVNRPDDIVAAVQNWNLDCWKNASTHPLFFGSLKLPGTITHMCYESDNYLWVATSEGLLCKADYKIPRWEMLSAVQHNSPYGILIAYDTKRKRICVLNRQPDATNGACMHTLELYYPMVNAVGLTDPVPVTSLRAGKSATFIAHLYGEAGEGITPWMVDGALVDPQHGRLITPFSGTELNGRVSFRYIAPEDAETETLVLDTKVGENHD